MRYQLVLQFTANSVDDFDRLVTLEDALIQELAGEAEVDGHDLGQSEFNIFVLTYEPASTFERARKCIGEQAIQYDWRAAYRELTSENYVVLWPPNLHEFSIA